MDILYDPQTANFQDLLVETYTAAGNGLHQLAMIGVRSVLEQLIISKIGEDKGSFYKNLDVFQTAGYISVPQFDVLKIVIESGHAAAHRGIKPSSSDLDSALSIMKGVLESICIDPVHAAWLSERVPARPGRHKLPKP